MLTLILSFLPLADVRYARPDLLMEASALVKADAGKTLRVLDARDKAKYDTGHATGAVHVDAVAWAKAFGDGKDAAAWSQRIGALGIDSDTPVVVYDDAVTGAARVWWILRYWGVKDVRLLNGGWAAYVQAGGATDKETPKVEAKTPKLAAHADRLATKADVLDLLKKESRQVVDARSAAEFRGDQKQAKRGGAVPGARHLDWADLVDPATKRFKSADELAKLLREHNVKTDEPCVTYCQSGGRASVLAFALELMGAKDVRNYYKSWAEWGNADDTPVATPKK